MLFKVGRKYINIDKIEMLDTEDNSIKINDKYYMLIEKDFKKLINIMNGVNINIMNGVKEETKIIKRKAEK